jgi:histidyl-tRNA synthetase
MLKRGLDYYKDDKGFEITGEYDGGVGFAIGIDRLIN